MSAPYTESEVRERIFQYLKDIAFYWSNVEGKTVNEKTEGAIFSVLVLLDGGSYCAPAFDIVLRPHPSDKEYALSLGEKYFEDGMVINKNSSLHDEFINHKS